MSREVVCQYCNNPAVLTSSSEVYREDYGPIWLCRPCGAWVGVHSNSKTNKPKGSLANAELRGWRKKAHAAFDPTWRRAARRGRGIPYARTEAYKQLAEALGIPVSRCHIGEFDIDTCKRAISACRKAKTKA